MVNQTESGFFFVLAHHLPASSFRSLRRMAFFGSKIENAGERRWMNGTRCRGENSRHSAGERRAQSDDERTGVNGEPERGMSEEIRRLESSWTPSSPHRTECSVISHIFFARLRSHRGFFFLLLLLSTLLFAMPSSCKNAKHPCRPMQRDGNLW